MANAVYATLETDLKGAVTQVLSSMVNLEAALTKSYEGAPQRFDVDVSAIIGVTATGLSGTVAIHCDQKLACKITSIMLCTDLSNELNDDVRDAMGELANVIVGSFKVALSTFIGTAAQMTVPTVIVGHTHHTHTIGGGQWMAQEFDVAGERLLVECQLIQEKK